MSGKRPTVELCSGLIIYSDYLFMSLKKASFWREISQTCTREQLEQEGLSIRRAPPQANSVLLLSAQSVAGLPTSREGSSTRRLPICLVSTRRWEGVSPL